MLVAEPNFLSRDERERLCQLLFEVGRAGGWGGGGSAVSCRWAGGLDGGAALCTPDLLWPACGLPPAPHCLPAPTIRVACLQVFNVAGYYGADQAVLSLYALGRLGGTVVDIGYEKIGARAWQPGSLWAGLQRGSLGAAQPAGLAVLVGAARTARMPPPLP